MDSKDNSSSHPQIMVIINCGLNVPLMLFSITGNSLVLAAIMKNPSLRSPSTIYLCSLAVSDLLVGLVVQPVYIATELKPSAFLSHTLKLLISSFCGVSLGTMTAISVDRFVALHYHLRYPTVMNKRNALCISGTIWFICVLFACIHFWDDKMYLDATVVSIAICILISTFSYVRIYIIVRRHRLQIQVQEQAVQSVNMEHNINMKRSAKSALNTFIYYISMIVCYTPVSISFLATPLHKRLSNASWGLADTVLFINSAINPFLYCWRILELRTAVVKILRYIICRQTAEN